MQGVAPKVPGVGCKGGGCPGIRGPSSPLPQGQLHHLQAGGAVGRVLVSESPLDSGAEKGEGTGVAGKVWGDENSTRR